MAVYCSQCSGFLSHKQTAASKGGLAGSGAGLLHLMNLKISEDRSMAAGLTIGLCDPLTDVPLALKAAKRTYRLEYRHGWDMIIMITYNVQCICAIA